MAVPVLFGDRTPHHGATLPAVAIALVLSMAGAVGGVGWRRLRA